MRKYSCGIGYDRDVPGDELTIDDPRTLRAIAHPVRMRILELFESKKSQRAADVAEALGIPANQASFHLRQLAKYGLIVEAPAEARDGRDRVWKLTSETINIETSTLAGMPGGRAAVDAFRQQWVGQVHRQIDKVAEYSASGDDRMVALRGMDLRLTRAQAKALMDDIADLVERHREATPADDAVPFELVALLGMVPGAQD